MTIQDDLEYPTEYGARPQQGKWATTVQPVFIIGGRSKTQVVTDDPGTDETEWLIVTSPGEAAARAGDGVCGWANEITPNAASVVLTTVLAPGLTYNIPAGSRVMITQYCYAVETVSDDCQFELGYTDQADGAGTFTPLGPHKHVFTGATNQGRTAFELWSEYKQRRRLRRRRP